MSRIYWDTMLFIYWFEDHPRMAERVRGIRARMERRGDRLCTGALAVGETLAGIGQDDAGAAVRAFFRGSSVEVLPFTLAAAERFAEIRGRTRAAPADAIHLATAGEAGVDLFLTDDRRLHRLSIPGIAFIAGLDTNLF